MKTTTTTIHTIEIDYDKALKRFVEINNNLIDDLADDSVNELYVHVQSYAQAIKDFSEYKIKNICQEGYTMMLLNDEELEFVESFFTRDPENEDIQLKVVRDGEVVEIIPSDYLQY
jgi:hypothetical protein